MIEIKEINKFLVYFMTGTVFGNLIWHFRTSNPLLHRELLLDLQRGGTPFLDWFIAGCYFLIIIGMMYGFFFSINFIRKRKMSSHKISYGKLLQGEIK